MGTFQAQDSDRIKRVFNQVLILELKYEDKEEQETKYGKFIFEKAMQGNPEISSLAGAIEKRDMSDIVSYRRLIIVTTCLAGV